MTPHCTKKYQVLSPEGSIYYSLARGRYTVELFMSMTDDGSSDVASGHVIAGN
jgi:hypothetical protein